MQPNISNVKLDVSVVSSLTNYGDYNTLLTYLSLITYKRLNEEYLTFEMIKPFLFYESEKEWTYQIGKLESMGLGLERGTHYTSKTKLSKWKEFAKEKTPDCFKLNGFVVFDMTKLYYLKSKKKEELKAYIYLSLTDSVFRGRSTSRSYKQILTGLKAFQQANIEEDYADYLVKLEYLLPVNPHEVANVKIPLIVGNISDKKLTKSPDEKRKIRAIQLGNRTILHKNFFTFTQFKYKKVFVQHEDSLKSLHDPLQNGAIQDWDSCDLVIDSMDKRNCLDKLWKNLSNKDYSKVHVLTNNGQFVNFRNQLYKSH